MADLDLARRAVAATGWHPTPPTTDRSYRSRAGVLWADMAPPGAGPEWLPDLEDPATIGCLHALVREAWRGPVMSVATDAQWMCGVALATSSSRANAFGSALCAALVSVHGAGATEAAALVAALEVSDG